MVANSHNEYGSKCTGQSTLTSKHSKCHIVCINITMHGSVNFTVHANQQLFLKYNIHD